MTADSSGGSDLAYLDMGIWADDGRVWLPKALYPKRTAAKKFAVAECGQTYIDVRVKTVFMRDAASSAFDEYPYVTCEADEPGAFEVWEIA